MARLAADLAELQLCAQAIAELDVLCNFAERAESLDYRAPQLDEEPGIHIEGGRHPVVEHVSTQPFIPNDVDLGDARRMLVVTGPNMGGKSTLMRQTALIAVLAYAGSFVPAASARIGPIDRIFTRIGAGDDLAGGRSTFMVEMTEMARILNNATPRSLVLVDEIGRGTSTYDGLALAWACARELANRTRSFTLFATHYFELTELPRHADGVANVHLDAIEHGRQIVFMHRVKDGPANRSYGLAVAALAGIPDEVIARAREILDTLESSPGASVSEPPSAQLGLFDASPAPEGVELLEALDAIDPDSLSPREALDALYRLKSPRTPMIQPGCPVRARPSSRSAAFAGPGPAKCRSVLESEPGLRYRALGTPPYLQCRRSRALPAVSSRKAGNRGVSSAARSAHGSRNENS